jgi:hypothetical protein
MTSFAVSLSDVVLLWWLIVTMIRKGTFSGAEEGLMMSEEAFRIESREDGVFGNRQRVERALQRLLDFAKQVVDLTQASQVPSATHPGGFSSRPDELQEPSLYSPNSSEAFLLSAYSPYTYANPWQPCCIPPSF